MSNEPRWVQEATVRKVHDLQIDEHGGSRGVRDLGLLSSAMARPLHLNSYKSDVSLAELAAAYAVGIVKNHPFVDGNKRTGAVVCETFLRLNGLRLVATDAQWCDIVLKLAAGEMDESELGEWLEANVEPLLQ